MAGGGRAAAVSAELLEAAGLALGDEDLPILGMLVERTFATEIAETLRLGTGDLEHRVMRMLGRLELPYPYIER